MTALALGKFDALHRGHFALAQRAAAFGAARLLTFSGMAQELGWAERRPLLAPGDRARVLNDWARTLNATIGEIELPFGRIRNMSPLEFINHVRATCGAQSFVVGEDFRFGRDRSGNATTLRELATANGMQVAILPPVMHANDVVSSSGVRAALSTGNVMLATALLGRPHRLLGTVVRGDGRGRQLGIPTANLGKRANQEPAPGVYAAWAHLDDKHIPAALNVGHLPSIAGDRPLTVEAHLIGWSGDCYDRPLALDLISRLRGEQRFSNLNELVAQIHSDIAAVSTLLNM